MTDSMRVDLTFYTSEEEYEDRSATRQRAGVTEAEAAEEIRAFRTEYRAFMDQHDGRMIVVIDPHFREDLFGQPKDWRAALQAERAARTTLSPGPDHNPVAWNPETDIPNGNRPAYAYPKRMTSGEIANEGMRRLVGERHVADPLTTFTLVPDVLAAVYRAISPSRTAGMDYTAYLALPLSFQLVDLRHFAADAPESDLLDWLDVVQKRYHFDPAEVFVIRDRLTFEDNNSDRLKRAYTPGMLRRRQRRLA